MDVEVSILSFVPPGAEEIQIGILVFDRFQNRLYTRFRRDWSQIADEQEAELLAELASDLIRMGRDLGAQKLLEYLEDVASHSILISPRQFTQTDDLEQLLDSLCRSTFNRPQEEFFQ